MIHFVLCGRQELLDYDKSDTLENNATSLEYKSTEEKRNLAVTSDSNSHDDDQHFHLHTQI